ncbi:hypothetical protein CBR_g83355, partial [Chara braunii]
IETLRDVVTL